MTAKRRGKPSTMEKATKIIESKILRDHRREAWEEQGRCCKYCLCPLTFTQGTADHKLARSKGGTNARDNIICACGPCNRAKASMTHLAFTKAMKAKQPSGNVTLMLSWSRRRVWLATYRAVRNIGYAVGRPNETPVGAVA